MTSAGLGMPCPPYIATVLARSLQGGDDSLLERRAEFANPCLGPGEQQRIIDHRSGLTHCFQHRARELIRMLGREISHPVIVDFPVYGDVRYNAGYP